MSALGHSWKVPARTINKELIADIEKMVIDGLSSDAIGERLGRKGSNVRNIIMRHTVGARRLRYDAKKEQGE